MSNCDRLADLLPIGKEKAVKSKELQEQLHLTRREVSQAVHDLRQKGMSICSDTYGYYIPKNGEELVQGYDCLWGKVIGNLSALKPMRREVKAKGLFTETREYRARKKKQTDEQKTESGGLSEGENPKEGVST